MTDTTRPADPRISRRVRDPEDRARLEARAVEVAPTPDELAEARAVLEECGLWGAREQEYLPQWAQFGRLVCLKQGLVPASLDEEAAR